MHEKVLKNKLGVHKNCIIEQPLIARFRPESGYQYCVWKLVTCSNSTGKLSPLLTAINARLQPIDLGWMKVTMALRYTEYLSVKLARRDESRSLLRTSATRTVLGMRIKSVRNLSGAKPLAVIQAAIRQALAQRLGPYREMAALIQSTIFSRLSDRRSLLCGFAIHPRIVKIVRSGCRLVNGLFR